VAVVHDLFPWFLKMRDAGPSKSFIVAATPRTGSGLLCHGLIATGIAGCPAECFAPHLRAMWCQYWSLSPDANFNDFLSAAIRYGTTTNGVYGLKIHWMHFADLARDAWPPSGYDDPLQRLFPEARFINIVRRDRRAQALSYFRALATEEWERFEGANDVPKEPPAFDADAILSLEADLSLQQQAWEEYFFKRGIVPLVVEYEALAQNYAAEIARTIGFLGLDPSVAQAVPPPQLVRQADELTSRWRSLMESIESRATAL
jgi:LPS sulfotransferase NodH